MTRTSALVAIAVAMVATTIAARQQTSAPVFRSSVDLIQLDVSVLDKDRRPVRGLAAADFTVLVDGKPRPVSAFRAVELPPPPPPPTAPWIRDVAPDVVTNARPTGRVIVIVIDDGSFLQRDMQAAGASFNTPVADIRAIEKAREIARTTVGELGPEDLAAVVFAENSHTSQAFTRDRSRLLAAINSAALFSSPSGRAATPLAGAEEGQGDLFNDPDNIMRPACPCGTCSLSVLDRVAASLSALPQQRKIVVYISAGVPMYSFVRVPPPPGNEYAVRKEFCNSERKRMAADVFRQAALSNVTIQSIDPKGLILGVVAEGGANPLDNPSTSRLETLRTMAETTGGRAVVNNNDMEREVPAVLAESSAYYLLGVESPGVKQDGAFHEVTVRVNRPGLEVRTRKGYYDPTEKERALLAANPSAELDAAVGSVLPKTDVPMEVSIAPLALPGGRAVLAIVAGVAQPNQTTSRNTARTERVELLATAFEPENGTGAGTERQTLNLEWNATTAASGSYEVLSRLPLKAGRYELRLGLKTGDGVTASVHAPVEVPDFAGDELSLSGVVLGAKPSPKVAPADAFADVLPLVPTARRAFGAKDEVTAFLRIYQNRPAFAAASVTTRITDGRNQVAADLTESLAGTSSSDGKTSSADYQIDLPVQDLAPGEYLLTIDVAARDKKLQRAVRFTVR